MLSLNLKDAYLHVPVQFNKYLRFAVSNQHFQFVCLPFGLSTSPRTFSKVLLPIIAILCRQGLQAFHYLDNILLTAKNLQILLNHRQILINTLQEFGWLINWGKSQLEPSQRLLFLGAVLDTHRNTIELPREKMATLLSKLEEISMTYLSASCCLSLLGMLSAMIPMVRWAHWRMRIFQKGFLNQWRKQSARPKDSANSGDEKVPRMVKSSKSPQMPSTSTRSPASDNIRCLSIRMGRTLQWVPSPRQGEKQTERGLQCDRIEGSPLCTESISHDFPIWVRDAPSLPTD